MRIGIIARADKTGLGNQTRNLTKLLNPSKVMVINSFTFNKNKQFFKFYRDYNSVEINGFPTERDIRLFLRDLDAVITCETFYNRAFISIAKQMGVRTYLQYNYEFLDHLVDNRLELPTKFLAPSYWNLHHMRSRFDNVVYLPPPLEFDKSIIITNRARDVGRNIVPVTPRFLHIVGRQAHMDRNGTLDLLEALKYTEAKFELVLKVQDANLPAINDPRVIIDSTQPENEVELYRNFDAMILPRRYAGLCLPMNEALSCGLPVIMTKISPNTFILPNKWLVDADKKDEFMARTKIEVYSANHKALAKKIDEFCTFDFYKERNKALEIALTEFAFDELRDKYMKELEN